MMSSLVFFLESGLSLFTKMACDALMRVPIKGVFLLSSRDTVRGKPHLCNRVVTRLHHVHT